MLKRQQLHSNQKSNTLGPSKDRIIKQNKTTYYCSIFYSHSTSRLDFMLMCTYSTYLDKGFLSVMPSLPWAPGSPQSLYWRGSLCSAAQATSLFFRPFFPRQHPSSVLWNIQNTSRQRQKKRHTETKLKSLQTLIKHIELPISPTFYTYSNCNFWMMAFKHFHTSRFLLQQAKSSISRTTPKAFWMSLFFSEEKRNTSIMEMKNVIKRNDN